MTGSGGAADRASSSSRIDPSQRTRVDPMPPAIAKMPDETAAGASKKINRAKPRIIGFKERIELNEQRERDRAGIPDNIVSRKLAVAVVFALIVWAYYVFVGRLVAPMLQRRQGTVGSIGEGVGLLIGFNILWLMFVWSYLRVILTKPGFAVDFLEREDPAVVDAQAGSNARGGFTYLGSGSNPSAAPDAAAVDEPDLSALTPAQRIVFEHRRSTGELTMHSLDLAGDDRDHLEAQVDDANESRDPKMLDGPRNLWPAEVPVPGFVDLGTSPPGASHVVDPSNGSVRRGRARAGTQPTVSDVENDCGRRLSAMSSAQHGSQAHLNPPPQQQQQQQQHSNPYPPAASTPLSDARPAVVEQQQHWLDERPLPPFNPTAQLCQYCHIYKPPRCHHCRHCGTCVLAMDHHCPWIGQCVGWHNHKFFLIFCLWSTLFTLYVLVVFAVKMAQMGSVDGQMIALIVIAAMFAAFTTTMGLGHIGLITSALTTLESFSIRAQRDRERHLLQQSYGFFKLGTKRRLLKKWNRDYGDLKTEGNRWYVGPAMWEWRRTMGDSPLGWVLPIGRPKGDGLAYDQNPRFAADGRRRKREEWPEDLR